LYFPFIQLVNYPYLTVRDVYLHAGPVQSILENGRLEYPKDPFPESWPTSFNLHAILSDVTGFDLVNANYILYLGLVVVFILTLFSFAKHLEKRGYKIAGYSAILFLCLFFNYLFDNFHHYSRTALGFTFLLLFFSVFFFLRDRRGFLLQLVLIIATFTTHPFQSFALLGFLFSFYIIKYKTVRIQFLLFSTVAFVGWFIFSGSTAFSEAISRISTFLSPQYTVPLAKTFVPSEVLPWWGILLRDFFKYSLVTLLAIASLASIFVIYRMHKNDENRLVRIGLVSFLPMSMMILLVLLLFPDWQISRFSPFAAFPAAFTALLLMIDVISDKRIDVTVQKAKFNRKMVIVGLLIFIMFLSAVVMILRLERNYYYGELNHPSEISALAFFFVNDNNSTVNIVSWRTTVYSAFFNYNGSHQVLRLWYLDLNAMSRNSTLLLLAQNALINQSQSVIRGIREEFDFKQFGPDETLLKTIDDAMILPKFNRIYSNEQYTIYSRPPNS